MIKFLKLRRAILTLIVLTALTPIRHASAVDTGSDNPVTITARTIQHKMDVDVFVADGNVVITQGKMRLSTDHAELDNKTGQVKGKGSVTYTDADGNTVFTDKVDFNTNTQKGVFYNGRFYLKSNKPALTESSSPIVPKNQWQNYEEMRITGNVIKKTGEYTYTVDKGSFTTCTADTPAWKLKGSNIHVTMDDEVTARNATFYLHDIPLLYLPYVRYPLERRTGFLTPTVGVNSNEGFKMYNRFFWAISDNQDATFGLDYRSRKGVEFGLDYRYVLDKDSYGELKNRYLYDWYEAKKGNTVKNRTTLNYKVFQRFSPTMTGKANLIFQKERNYYREYSDATDQRLQRYTESNVFVTQSFSNSTLVGLIQYKYDLTQSNKETLQRLPEIRYTVNRTRISGTPWFYYFDSSATRFDRKEGSVGERIDLYPHLIADYQLGYGFVLTPRLGYRETLYSRTAGEQKLTSREIYDAGVGLNVKIAKVYKANGFWGMDAIRHQIEPGLSYEYIPHVHHQKVLPQWDSIDNIAESNNITWSLTNRLTGKYAVGEQTVKQDLMIFTLSQSFNVEEAKRQEHGGPNRRPWSTIVGDMYIYLNKYMNIRHKATYDPAKGNMVTYNTDLTMQPGGPWFFVLGHRYTRQSTINFIKVSAGYRLNKNWAALANVWYDQEQTKVREQDFTVSYSGQCWGFSVHYIEKAGENAPDIVRKRETQYLFTIDLKGLTSVGF